MLLWKQRGESPETYAQPYTTYGPFVSSTWIMPARYCPTVPKQVLAVTRRGDRKFHSDARTPTPRPKISIIRDWGMMCQLMGCDSCTFKLEYLWHSKDGSQVRNAYLRSTNRWSSSTAWRWMTARRRDCITSLPYRTTVGSEQWVAFRRDSRNPADWLGRTRESASASTMVMGVSLSVDQRSVRRVSPIRVIPLIPISSYLQKRAR